MCATCVDVVLLSSIICMAFDGCDVRRWSGELLWKWKETSISKNISSSRLVLLYIYNFGKHNLVPVYIPVLSQTKNKAVEKKECVIYVLSKRCLNLSDINLRREETKDHSPLRHKLTGCEPTQPVVWGFVAINANHYTT